MRLRELFTRTTPINHVRVKAFRRLSRLAKGDVLDHLDAVLSGSWKACEDLRRVEDPLILDEAERGLQQALGALDAIRARIQPTP